MITELLRSSHSVNSFDRQLAVLGYRLASLRFLTCSALGRTGCTVCAKGAIVEMSDMVKFLAGTLGAAYATSGVPE